MLPSDLADLAAALTARLGAAGAERVAAGWSAPRLPALRANVLRADAAALQAELAAAGIPVQPHPLSPWTFTTTPEGERLLKRSEAFAAGRLYMQSLGSQFPALIGALPPGAAILDACAAPGGKTTLMAMRGGRGRPLVAVERAAVRAQKLRHTLRRQGADWVETVEADARSLPARIRARRFAHILVDAPCTGTGTIRADDPRTYAHLAGRYDGYAAIKAQQQLGILRAAAALAPSGGLLIYSTCSIDPLENEEIAAAFLADGGWRPEPVAAWGALLPGAAAALAASGGRALPPELATCAVRWLPGEAGEGGFAAAFRRQAPDASR